MSSTQQQRPMSTLRIVALGATLLAVGTVGFYTLPGMISAKAKGSHAVNAFYCAAVTLTTVGYGDICPDQPTLWGKAFIVCFTLGGLGMFCGPVMELTSSWKHEVPGGLLTLLLCTVGVGVVIFTVLEGVTEAEAIYASIITGTTIGYGDISPRTDIGKIAVALYAIGAVNVVAALLQPGRQFLESFCRAPPEPKRASASSAALSEGKKSE